MPDLIRSNISAQVLIACGDAQAADRIAEALAAWRYKVLTSMDSAEAVHLMTGEMPPAVAMLDADLSNPTAAEIAITVHHKAKKQAPWLVLMSGHVDANVVARANDAGIDDVLLKPVDVEQLRVRLIVAQRVQALQNEIKDQAHALRFHASHDYLTGLWNRTSLVGMLLQETARVLRMGAPMALLLLDLDNFARVNTDYGYESGDAVLQELASRFRRHLRSYDLIGRMGEDEFLIVLPGCDAEQAEVLMRRLTGLIADKPFEGCGRESVWLSASIGVAPSLGRSPFVVLREAEEALAEAKRNRADPIANFERAELQSSTK